MFVMIPQKKRAKMSRTGTGSFYARTAITFYVQF